MKDELKNKRIRIAFILAALYISIGSYDLISRGKISNAIDKLVDSLDLFLIFPSHIFGSITYWTFRGLYDTKLWIWLGQLIGLIIYWIIAYLLIKIFRHKKVNETNQNPAEKSKF